MNMTIDFFHQRKQMVEEQLKARDIVDSQVLQAMSKVPREKFLPEKFQYLAYRDGAQAIGYGQTISQPYIVAFMSQALDLQPTDKVLEIGTGSGYQAAILAEIVKEVFSIEFVPELFVLTKKLLLDDLGYKNIKLRQGDGRLGWPDKAPFDKIIVTAAGDNIPKALIKQLVVGGKLLIPQTDKFGQNLVLVNKTEKGIAKKKILPVIFVPLQ